MRQQPHSPVPPAPAPRRLLAHPLALALLAAPLLAACQPEPQTAAAPEPPRPVQTAPIHLTPIEPTRTLTGTVRARREAEQAFRAGGRIASRAVELGQVVRAGDVLARLDPADLALALQQAAAQLASAEAGARNATAEAARSRSLRASGFASASQEEQRRSAAQSADEQVTQARAALALARNRLGYATLRASSDGVVTALLAEAGQVVAEGAPVLRLAENATLELVVPVPESLLPLLQRPGATAGFWTRPGERVPATLREVAPQPETGLRTYAARFSLPDPPAWLALGMTGSIRLAGGGELAASLPLTALHDRGAGPMVWRIRDNRAEAVPVQVLGLQETTARVAGALQEGQQVVSLGVQLLDPGQPVRVVDQRLAATLR